MSASNDNKLAVFEGRQIRKMFHEGEWWFSIIDVVQALVGGDRPRKYGDGSHRAWSRSGISRVDTLSGLS